jgi:coniferyl-aldehyde dehydrogenase
MEGHDAVALMGPVAAPRMGAFAVRDPDPASALMKEEIFGPVLPVVPYDDLAQAEAFVSARPVPLALYAFGDRALAERVVGRLRSGGAAVNDCVVQVAAHTLPFGGAGTSGWGSYHGEEGFRSVHAAAQHAGRRALVARADGAAALRGGGRAHHPASAALRP